MQHRYPAQRPHRLGVETTAADDDVVVITLNGEADLHTASILSDALADAIALPRRVVVIDMTDVTFVDSMMLGVLLSTSRKAKERATDMLVVVADPHVRRIFELTLLDHVFDLYPRLDAALEACHLSVD